MVKHNKLEFFVQHGERNYSGFFFLEILHNSEIVFNIRFLFSRQILGIKNDQEIDIDDPCSDEFYQYFRRTAKNNAQIYEKVFMTLPSNHIRTFASIEEYTQQPKLKDVDPLAVCSIFIDSIIFKMTCSL